MEKIKLGTLCLTNVDKTFNYPDGLYFIKKGTYVIICDTDYIKDGYVTVELEEYDTVFDYEVSELIIVKK